MKTAAGRPVRLALLLAAAAAAIQLFPYGRDHVNPPVVREPAWDSPGTRALARRACFDCHSNETVWPGYADIAPLSWLTWSDVSEGRSKLNFSDWTAGRREGERPDKIAGEIREGEMPPLLYRIAHPEARLSGDEKNALAAGLRRTAAGAASRSGRPGRRG